MQKPTKWECKKQSSGEIQQNAKDIQENTLPTFARFRSGCTSVLTVVKHSRMKTKRRMSETQIEKKQQRDTDRLNCFQQNKRAEELACGMAVRNAKLEQLGHKVEDQELITISAKAAGDEAAAWCAKCAEGKHSFPSRSLCQSVSIALQSPRAFQIEQEENAGVDTQQLCALNRKERSDAQAQVERSRIAARKHRAKAIMKKALTKSGA